MNWISFRGVSSQDLGLIVEKMPCPPVPVKRFETVAVPGRSGSLIVGDGAYGDIELSATFNFYGTRVDVNGWLNGRGDLILSDSPDKKYIASLVKAPVVTRRRLADGNNYDSLNVRFLCEPFKYEAVPDVYTLSRASTVIGEGTLDSEPLIVVNGTGDCTLTVGNAVLTLTGLTSGITIDCAKKIAYDANVSLNHLVGGTWPMMSKESTAVSWTGSVTGVTITPNWRWL